MKPWLPSLIVAVVIAFSGCSEPQQQLNTTSTVEVELVKDRAATVEGKYLLRFETAAGQYVTEREKAQALLLTNWEVRAPEGLRILERNAVVNVVDFPELKEGQVVTSQVFELKTTLTIAAAPEAAALSSTYDVIASFPRALVIRQALNALTPAGVPEIRFHVLHHPSNSSRAFKRIGKDLGLVVVFILVAIAGFWLAAKSWFFVEEIASSGCLPMFVLLPTIGLIGVGLVGVGGTFYYLFMILRDLWWILSRLWGG